MRHAKSVVSALALGAVVFGGALAGGATASGANAPMMGGAIQLWVNPSLTGHGGGKVLLTGAIADYGTGQNVNAAGKADAKGNYKKLVLKHGTILVNGTKLNAATNNANPTVYNKSDCSVVIDASAPARDRERHRVLHRDHGLGHHDRQDRLYPAQDQKGHMQRQQ